MLWDFIEKFWIYIVTMQQRVTEENTSISPKAETYLVSLTEYHYIHEELSKR